MRPTVSAILLALALAAPASAADRLGATRAAAPAVAASGSTLSIKGADGFVRLDLEKGTVIGRLGYGTLEVRVSFGDDCSDLDSRVSGEETQRDHLGFDEEGTPILYCRFSGKGIRFRLAGENLVVRFVRFREKLARNLDLSAVGVGRVTFDGIADSDGRYAVNGDEYSRVPAERKVISLPPRKSE